MFNEKIIKDIAAKTGTPVYIYDGNILKNSASRLFEAFRDLNPHYSLKANPNIGILKILRSAGLGAEVSSEFEARAALQAGCRPGHIMYDGPAKTLKEIQHALKSGISHFNVESRFEAERIISELKKTHPRKTAEICLRVNPRGASSAAEIMTGVPSRFGIDEEILPDEAEFIRKAGLNINGVHFYAGSQILNKNDIVRNFKKGLSILAGLIDKNLINGHTAPLYTFGPGIGTSYGKNTDDLAPSSIGSSIRAAAVEFRKKYGGLTVKTEIGRFLVSRAGIYVVKTIETKTSRKKRYVLTDGGIHQFMRCALTGAKHRARVIGKSSRSPQQTIITGSTCTPYDVLTEAKIAEPAPGALLAVLDAGAYGWSMGMANFLSRPVPPEVIIEDGKWRIIREAGAFETLIKPFSLKTRKKFPPAI